MKIGYLSTLKYWCIFESLFMSHKPAAFYFVFHLFVAHEAFTINLSVQLFCLRVASIYSQTDCV